MTPNAPLNLALVQVTPTPRPDRPALTLTRVVGTPRAHKAVNEMTVTLDPTCPARLPDLALSVRPTQQHVTLTGWPDELNIYGHATHTGGHWAQIGTAHLNPRGGYDLRFTDTALAPHLMLGATGSGAQYPLGRPLNETTD